MPAESTVRDALVAEMLGDIGKLHDAVESLKEVLPRETEATANRITGLIGHLRKAGDAYQGQMEAYANSKLRSIQEQMEKDAATARARMVQAVEATLSEVERTVNSTVRASMIAPVEEVVRTLQQSVWTNLGLCLLAGLIGGSVPLIAWSFMS
ncbi:MAG: hypothetical protein ACK5A0_14010 [Polaromonas sp.]|jgi:hypothetical protein